jgi:hypothetical protein
VVRLADEKARLEADAKRARASEARTRDEAVRLADENARIESRAREAEANRAEQASASRAAAPRRAPRVAAIDASPVRPMGTPMVSAVAFHGEEGYGHLDIAVGGDVKVTVGRVTKMRAELILDGVDVAARIEGAIDVTRFGSPVRSVRTYRDPQSPKRVRVIVELIAPVTSRVQQTPTGLRWKLQGTDMA